MTDTDFFDKTRDLLRLAISDRDAPALRRARIRIDGAKFNALTDDQQERLLRLYDEAREACGMSAP
jgi:hypothetical protein